LNANKALVVVHLAAVRMVSVPDSFMASMVMHRQKNLTSSPVFADNRQTSDQFLDHLELFETLMVAEKLQGLLERFVDQISCFKISLFRLKSSGCYDAPLQ
jgi:hypothetical protein